jgi:hypothetical protein
MTDEAYDDTWFPEEPGQIRRAFCDRYELHPPHTYVDRHVWSIDCPGWDEVDEADLRELQAQPPCEHGMSAHLCAGPSHYPMEM